MKTKAFGIFLIVEQLLNRCKRVIENILQAPDLTSVASVSLAIFAQMRHVAREMLQAKVALEAEQCRSRDVTRCCPDASVKYVHTRTVSPETLLGEIRIVVGRGERVLVTTLTKRMSEDLTEYLCEHGVRVPRAARTVPQGRGPVAAGTRPGRDADS